jgi:hypothetical protein
MQAKLLDHSWMKTAVPPISLGKGIGWGIIGGLAATIVMDLVLISAFAVAGMPPFTCFSIVGDTLVSLFSFQGVVNSAPLGASAHYLIGPVLGAVFGAAVRSRPALHAGSWKKTVLLAALYTEIVSQPLLALTPIFLRMTMSETLEWYCGAMVMHLIWGCVLGAVLSQGLRLPVATNPR